MRTKLLTVIAVLFLGVFPAGAQRQYYIKGAVTSVTGTNITVGARTLTLKGDCRVIIITQKDGSYYEHSGNLHDLTIGDSAYARVDYDTAVEIKIER